MILVQYPAIGQKWVSHFIKCHSQLQSVIGQRIDACWVKDTTLDKLTTWFNVLESVIEEFDILPENTVPFETLVHITTKLLSRQSRVVF